MIKGGKGGLVNNGTLTGIGHTEDALGRSVYLWIQCDQGCWEI